MQQPAVSNPQMHRPVARQLPAHRQQMAHVAFSQQMVQLVAINKRKTFCEMQFPIVDKLWGININGVRDKGIYWQSNFFKIHACLQRGAPISHQPRLSRGHRQVSHPIVRRHRLTNRQAYHQRLQVFRLRIPSCPAGHH